MPTEAPYGSWVSPITAEESSGASISFQGLAVDLAFGRLVHLEQRPPSGAHILVDTQTGVDITPQGSNTRTRVHEYGGGAFAYHKDQVIMSDFKSNTVYHRARTDSDGWTDPIKVVPDNEAFRYADFSFHPIEPLVAAVKEDHTIDKPSKVKNSLVLIDLTTKEVREIVSGNDFYSNPRFSIDGKQILWKEWSLPHMPWESSFLYVAHFVNGRVGSKHLIAGGPNVSVAQPDFVESTVVYMSDETGFQEPWYWSYARGKQKMLSETPKYDLGDLDWAFGLRHWAMLDCDRVIFSDSGSLRLYSLAKHAILETFKLPYTSLSYLAAETSTEVIMLAASAHKPTELVQFSLKTKKTITLKSAGTSNLDGAYISAPQRITFPSMPDPGSSAIPEAHAIYYPPKNPDFQDSKGLPPVLVRTHGGPTSSASADFSLGVQYFTSRGFAFVDVDYGGSSGYGKVYRDRLRGNWGIVDMQDSVACVQHLVKQKLVSAAAIFGGSAGGYTTLQALCHYSDIFKAGCSMYGIADLLVLAGDTHKFESQYLFDLLSGTPEQVPHIYKERSPITNAANITSPLLVLQGEEDRVVPKEQAELIVKAVKANGTEVEYHLFEGEGHGFRQTDNQITSFKSRLRFFRKAFGVPGGEA